MQKRHLDSLSSRLALGAAIALAIILLFRLSARFFAQPESDLISWDQAARAGEAVAMAKQIRSLQLVDFVRHTLALNWWPPLHYLIMIPFVLVIGPGLKAAIIPSLAAYFFSMLSILFAFKELPAGKNGDSLLGYSLLFSLVVTSPVLLSSATWAMLEIFGVFLTYLGLALYFKATAGDTKAMRLCGLIGFLLLTLKYSYALFFSAAILAAELGRAGRLRPKTWLSRRRLSSLKSPVFFPVYLLCGLLVYISISGGGRFELLGIRVSLTDICNPAMFLYQYLFLVGLLRMRRGWARIKGHLEPGQRELLVWGALPAGAFLLLPDKIKAVVMNLRAAHQQMSGIPVANTLYYLRSVIVDYSLFWPVGIFISVLIIIAFVNWRRAPANLRLIMLFSLAGFLVTSLSFGLRESRYIATFVPALWVVAAWSFLFVMKKLGRPFRAALSLAFLIAAALAIASPSLLIGRALRQPWAPWAHHGIEYRRLLEPVIAETQGKRKVLIVGASDLGFAPLLSWKLNVAQFKNPAFSADIDPWQDVHLPGSDFLEKTASRGPDSIVLFRVKNGVREQAVRKWSRALRRSGRYSFAKKRTFRAPTPCQILFFVRTEAAWKRQAQAFLDNAFSLGYKAKPAGEGPRIR